MLAFRPHVDEENSAYEKPGVDGTINDVIMRGAGWSAFGAALFFISYNIIIAFVLINVVVAVLLEKCITPEVCIARTIPLTARPRVALTSISCNCQGIFGYLVLRLAYGAAPAANPWC